MSTLSVGTIKSNTTSPPVIQNSSATEVGTFCRAWVNFNGVGVVTSRADFNVSFITDEAVGIFTVNFETAMSDANYCTLVTAQQAMGRTSANDADGISTVTSGGAAVIYTTTAVQVGCQDSGGGANDSTIFCVAVFR
jgi:hypothetical protein